MRYAIAIWNFVEDGVPLPDVIAEFAGFGYDCISFTARQITDADPAEVREVARGMRAAGLTGTIHCGFNLMPADIERLAEVGEDGLLAVTFDAVMTATSRGYRYDTKRMVALLHLVEQATRGTETRFGVEDFPLDQEALDCYRSDLEPLLACERFGMLVDLGHLNMRTQSESYFRQWGVAENLQRTPLPIIEVHVHDNNGERDEHGHIGRGNAPFDEMARGLRAAGFDGVSTIEIAPSFHGSTPAESKPRAKESLERWRELWEATALAQGTADDAPLRPAPGTEAWVGS